MNLQVALRPHLMVLNVGLFLVFSGVHNIAADSNAMKMLFNFTLDPSPQPWVVVNDGVMGGLSKGATQLNQNGMCFSGELSLKNNGGFSSIRQQVDMNLSDCQGVRIRLLGDGRTYQLRLESDARYRNRWPVSFSGDIPTIAGEWVEVDVPFDKLRQSWRGQDLSEYRFNPATIQRIGLILADKQPGDFKVEVAWIGAYR